MPLPSQLLAAVEKHWGFTALRPLQEQAIAAALAGRDSLVVMPTGGGKSLCYQAPALVRNGLAVVVSPLIALMKDQVDSLARIGVPAARLDSTLTLRESAAIRDRISKGEIRLVFTSPERLVNTEVPRLLREAGAHTVAVDEAHCVSHWGHDFRPEYRQLGLLREHFPDAAVHGYTATATERVRADIARQLGLRSPEVLVGNFDRPNLTYRVLPKQDLLDQVRDVLDRHRGSAGIVYCLRRKDVDAMCGALASLGYRALPYHAGMTPEARRTNQEAFAAEDADIMVATVAFGMGIDRSNVRFVIHAAMPKSIEHYQQETGRAGRDGLPSECVLFFTIGDLLTFKSIIEKSASEAGASPEYTAASIRHLEDMGRYARGAECRHAALVRYFGQKYEAENCRACDQCLGDTELVPDSTVIAQKILSCVARVKEGFGVNHVMEVLRGSNAAQVRQRGHDQLSTFGLLKDAPKEHLRDWIFQLIGQDLLAQSEGEYPLLKLNGASWEVMKGQRPVKLVQPLHERKTQPAALPEGVDVELFNLLRELRRNTAIEAKMTPEQVFSDSVLAELARGRPTTQAALKRVSGVGDVRLQSFGEAFLNAIKAHCKRTGLSTDVPMPKTMAQPKLASSKSSPRKEAAFQMYRKGASVAEVAKKLDLAANTVAEYLCEMIQVEKPESIFAWVPEAVCERVAAAAEIHGTGRLKPVFLEMNEEVPYEQIRIVFAFLTMKGN
jgi:ATP-dependent DNA helicase RecQ